MKFCRHSIQRTQLNVATHSHARGKESKIFSYFQYFAMYLRQGDWSFWQQKYWGGIGGFVSSCKLQEEKQCPFEVFRQHGSPWFMVLCNITKSVYILNIWNQPTSIQTRTVRSTRDGEQTTTTLAKRILYVLLLPWNLNVLTTYLGDFKLHTFQYVEYYGDGDDKSFSRVENVYQASGITVKKKTALVMCRKGWAQLFAS